MRNWLEVRSPFFRPMWRRWVVFVLVAGWAGMEVIAGSVFWAILFGASAVYLGWAFFLAFEDGPDL